MRHDNNFTLLRFIAASMVIIAHAYDLENVAGLADPLYRLTGRSLGWAGVAIFFAMSGYLIMGSLDRSRDLKRFAVARALRIFPGLIVCIVATILMLGLFVSTLPLDAYFRDPRTIGYLIGNATLLSIRFDLPGVFAHNPYPNAVNGSIWTLPYEVACYAVAATLAGAGLLAGRSMQVFTLLLGMAICIVALVAAAYLDGIPGIARAANFARLALCFQFGMIALAANVATRVRAWHAAVTATAAWALAGTPLFDVLYCGTLAILAFRLAFLPSPLLLRLSRAPDYSYGIYIYAFPIQQWLIGTAPSLPPPIAALVAFLLVLLPAGLSWHFVEKPALGLRNRQWRDGKIVPVAR